MSRLHTVWRNICKKLIWLLAAVSLGTLLQIGAFSIPVEYTRYSMDSSAGLLMEEEYPEMSSWFTSRLDNYTDALMMLHASHDAGYSIPVQAMLVCRPGMENIDNPVELLRAHYQDGADYYGNIPYSYYWHGYLVFLKPLMTIMNLSGIRVVNGIAQTALLLWILRRLHRRNLKYCIIPFLVTVLFLNPVVIAMSLQFSTCYYLILIGVLLILHLKHISVKRAVPLFFFLGAATSFLDFLTYPLAVFGIPAAVYCCLRGRMTLQETLQEGSTLLGNWLTGYLGMWCGKWIVGSCITGTNVLRFGAAKITERTALNPELSGQTVNYLRSAVSQNLKAFLYTPAVLLLVLALAYGVYLWFRGGRLGAAAFFLECTPYCLLAAMPIIWYLAAANHSVIHYWFTNKALSVSLFCLLCVVYRLGFAANHPSLIGRMEIYETPQSRRRKKQNLTIGILGLVVLLILSWCGLAWFEHTYVIVGRQVFRRDTTQLNLTEKNISIEDYEKIQEKLPECQITWMVPFQGTMYSSDIVSLTVEHFSQEDMKTLACFPSLKEVHGENSSDFQMLAQVREKYPQIQVFYSVPVDGISYPQDAEAVSVRHLTREDVQALEMLPMLREIDGDFCTDYAQLQAVQKAHPEWKVNFLVQLEGEWFASNAAELILTDPDVEEIMPKLQYLNRLERVRILEPSCQPELLLQMRRMYPELTIQWEKSFFGKVFTSEDTLIDFSGNTISVEQAEEWMAFFPNAEKLDMSFCGIENEKMAAFREKKRQEYKVVWTVIVTRQEVRTDDTIFHACGRGVTLIDEYSNDLVYCEDMIIVDVGHSHIKYVEWVRGMPNLKYLILADNWIKDLTPLSSCKNLVYLELFINDLIPDLTPLQGCTSLEDLSIADTFVDPTPLAQMPWLKNLWVINNSKLTPAVKQLLEESLPNTRVESRSGFTTGYGWRELQNYYDMREMMGLPANAW